jgi:hypothetical protein
MLVLSTTAFGPAYASFLAVSSVERPAKGGDTVLGNSKLAGLIEVVTKKNTFG